MRKTYLLIAALIIAILLLSLLTLLTKNQKEVQPPPVIIFQPSPSISSLPQTTDERIKLQLQADQKLGTQRDALLQKYPWYLKLPLQQTNYFVYFNTVTETFIAKLYPQKSSASSLDEQTNDLKNTVMKKIKELGANADSYEVAWKIIPE
ncbi:hypothetical protein HYU93_05325 [Candidatus Daviesbacteria bacterium]|nr:hypothetical protein [Candidatus Daviesbacteria bacterium]